jgi:hypothetical protein
MESKKRVKTTEKRRKIKKDAIGKYIDIGVVIILCGGRGNMIVGPKHVDR